MKSVRVEDAVGMVLGHDITRIVRGETKERAFKKGHVVTAPDIPKLLDLGKKHIYVFELPGGCLHENDAARALASAAAGPGLSLSEPKEGKIELSAQYRGLLTIDTEALEALNRIDQIMFATIHTNQVVEKGKKVAGTRVIPLVIDEQTITTAVELLKKNAPLIQVKPLAHRRIGIVTTGSEVFEGRIRDQFGPVLRDKFSRLGCEIVEQVIVPDDVEKIAGAIQDLVGKGADFIATTGGMSVDPDDVTPEGIRRAGGEVVTYGAPVLPGAMFLLAYREGIPIVGLPGCVMYCAATVFELIVPRLLAGEHISKNDFARLGHGGLCLGCEQCRYPDCGFGK